MEHQYLVTRSPKKPHRVGLSGIVVVVLADSRADAIRKVKIQHAEEFGPAKYYCAPEAWLLLAGPAYYL